MADVPSKIGQDGSYVSNVADNQNEVNLVKQTSKRASSRNPSPAPPHKSPCTDATSSTTQMPDVGEGRMETDQNDMQVENMKGREPTEGLSVSRDARRKSWRSTISLRSLPAPPNANQTLCRSISTSLSQQERLEKLMEASMRLATERAQNSLQSMPNASLESFQKQVERMQKEWCCVAKNIRSEAQSQQLPTSTASDPAVQRAMEKTRKATQRLQAECDSWEALLNKHRSKAEELERRVEAGQASSVTLDPSSLSQSSQYQVIQSKPDYRSILSRQLPILQTMELVMDTQCKMVKGLLSIQKQSELLVKETSGRLAADAGLEDLSPDLIRNLVALPSSSRTS